MGWKGAASIWSECQRNQRQGRDTSLCCWTPKPLEDGPLPPTCTSLPLSVRVYILIHLIKAGADPHATNHAGECVFLVSSAFCSSVIYDFVVRPGSLEFISKRLNPDVDVTSALRLNEGSENQMSESKEVKQEEKGSTKQFPTLLECFPEITTIEATRSSSTVRSKRFRSVAGLKRQSEMSITEKLVSELLMKVLEALQLYQGAEDESGSDMILADYQGKEKDKWQRWCRNDSMRILKQQLASCLRKSNANIPRITRNLSFSTLSEGEMALYLREWKSLRRQQNQLKRKSKSNRLFLF